MTYKEIVEKLNAVDNFSFSRYGDGEFNAILGASKGQDKEKNCDGHKYFKDMGMRLYRILDAKPSYTMGLQSLAKRLKGGQPDFDNLIDGIDWVDSDVMHRQSIRTNGNLNDLFEALQTRDIIFVANENLIWMINKLTDDYSNTAYNHIVISPKDCWLEYKEVLERLHKLIAKDTVILYCASMMTEVLIDDVWNKYGDSVTQIDIGSLFDPFCNESTRSYHKKLNIR